MSYNGSGTFNLSAGNPVVTGTTISSTWANTTLSDIATGLTTALTKDGQSTPTANLPMGTFKLTGMGVGSAATDSVTLGQAQAAAFAWCGTSGGSANAQTLTPSPAITAYAAGQTFRFKAGFSNAGATTVAISGLATIALQASGAACVGGEITANQFYQITLDTTSTAQLLQLGSGAGSTLTLTSTDAGAGAAPLITLDRNSASPAASDLLGDLVFTGRDSGGNSTVYADIVGRIVDPTNGSEDGEIVFRRMLAGVFTEALSVRLGLYFTTTAGGDTGVGTINNDGYYVAGVRAPDVAATQAQQETGTSTVVAVTPGRQQFHPSAPKCWCQADAAGAISASYNMTSVTDVGTGVITFTIATDFSSANWSGSVSATQAAAATGRHTEQYSQTAGAITGQYNTEALSSPADPASWSFIGLGDQA